MKTHSFQVERSKHFWCLLGIVAIFSLVFVHCVFAVEKEATLGGMDSDGNYRFEIYSNGTGKFFGTDTFVQNATRSIRFTPGDFTLLTGAPLTASTYPGLETENYATAIVWDDGEGTPVQVTFAVPADYLSGGSFKVWADSSANTGDGTYTQVDFNVYVNVDGTSWATSATNQSPVALTELAGTPEAVTLSVATDFESLSAGQLVTFNMWRDDASDGLDDLEAYYVDFYYQSAR